MLRYDVHKLVESVSYFNIDYDNIKNAMLLQIIVLSDFRYIRANHWKWALNKNYILFDNYHKICTLAHLSYDGWDSLR